MEVITDLHSSCPFKGCGLICPPLSLLLTDYQEWQSKSREMFLEYSCWCIFQEVSAGIGLPSKWLLPILGPGLHLIREDGPESGIVCLLAPDQRDTLHSLSMLLPPKHLPFNTDPRMYGFQTPVANWN